jgi:hypothetical protein
MIGLTGPDTATRYRQFAVVEARGNSALYEQWALAVADDADLLGRLDALPSARRQPNLLFAAARFLGTGDIGAAEFTTAVKGRWDDVAAVMAARSTQTNEAGRCAVLLPVLSRIAGPIALIEVGASAGACLFPDRYGYRYETHRGIVALDPPGGSTVTLSCRTNTDVDVTVPDVVWRAGLDLNPLDATDLDTRSWLRALVWPGQDERLARLDAALDIAAADPPHLIAGDLVTDLPDLIDAAPGDTTVVVMHSAVLAYVDPRGREAFRAAVTDSRATWISNEAAAVFPEIAGRLTRVDSTAGRFVLAVDGVPTALTGPHGQSYEQLR